MGCWVVVACCGGVEVVAGGVDVVAGSGVDVVAGVDVGVESPPPPPPFLPVADVWGSVGKT